MSPDAELIVASSARCTWSPSALGVGLFVMFLRSESRTGPTPPDEDDGGGGNDRVPAPAQDLAVRRHPAARRGPAQRAPALARAPGRPAAGPRAAARPRAGAGAPAGSRGPLAQRCAYWRAVA